MTLFTGPQAAHQTGIPYRMLHHWTSHGAITPTKPANGAGTRTHWNTRDIRILTAISHVTADLHTLGIQPTSRLIARLWHDLNHHIPVTITQGTVTITVDLCDTAPAHLGSEAR
jgi:hypothetical protein